VLTANAYAPIETIFVSMHARRMDIQDRKNVIPGAKRFDPRELWIRLGSSPGEVDDSSLGLVERDEHRVAAIALRRASGIAAGENMLRAALTP